jgi:LysM repeat protein
MSQNASARKFFRTAVVVAIATSSLFGFVNGAAANSKAGSAEFEYVTISAGQTLWSLAEELAPNSDPQDFMQEVVNLNGLTSTDLKPGQRLALPR